MKGCVKGIVARVKSLLFYRSSKVYPTRQNDFYAINYDKVSHEQVQFIYDQACICFKDFIDIYNSIKVRSEKLLLLFVTVMFALCAYIIANFATMSEVFLYPGLLFAHFLFVSMVFLGMNLFTSKTYIAGVEPKYILRKEIVEDYDYTQLLLSQITSLQDKITDMQTVNKRIARNNNLALVVVLSGLIISTLLSVFIKLIYG